MMADVVLQYGNKSFEKRENKSISICILNNGGIRAILPKGNVTFEMVLKLCLLKIV
jgi:2',3'-cyclic-nucleotide 2'-phosphodiesterase (5'-nucleotidase family)